MNKDKKNAEFQYTALSILAARGEMDADALAKAVKARMGMGSKMSLPAKVWGAITFPSDFVVQMNGLEKTGSVTSAMKSGKKFSYSITDDGRKTLADLEAGRARLLRAHANRGSIVLPGSVLRTFSKV